MQVEFILMGGTFMSLPLDYRDYFIRGLHDALSGHMSSNVDEAVKYSEQSHTRCIGLTIETRPDYCLTPHLQQVWLLPDRLPCIPKHQASFMHDSGKMHLCDLCGLCDSHLQMQLPEPALHSCSAVHKGTTPGMQG